MPIPDQIQRLIEQPSEDNEDDEDDEGGLTPDEIQAEYSTLSDSDIYVTVEPNGGIVDADDVETQPAQCEISDETPGLRNEPAGDNGSAHEMYDDFVGFTFGEVADQWVVAWDDQYISNPGEEHAFMSLFPVDECSLSRHRFIPRLQFAYTEDSVRVGHELTGSVNVDVATVVSADRLGELIDASDIESLSPDQHNGVSLETVFPLGAEIINGLPGPTAGECESNVNGGWYRFEFADSADDDRNGPDEVYAYGTRGSSTDHLSQSAEGLFELSTVPDRVVAVADEIEPGFMSDFDIDAPISHAEPVDPATVDIPRVEAPDDGEYGFTQDDGRTFGYNPETDEVVTDT